MFISLFHDIMHMQDASSSSGGAGSKIYNRSQSVPANEAVAPVRHRGQDSRPRMQRQSSLLQRTALIRR